MPAPPPRHLTRSRFLARAAAGAGGAALAGGLAATASAAEAEFDLAWLRFGVALEFVSAAYYVRARRSGLFTRTETRVLERATAAEHVHRAAFRDALLAAGETPIDDEDLEVDLPATAFSDRSRAIALGRRLKALSVHAYLGALVEVQSSRYRAVFGPVGASEALQLGFLAGLAGAAVLADPLPPVHGLPTAAEELARYLP